MILNVALQWANTDIDQKLQTDEFLLHKLCTEGISLAEMSQEILIATCQEASIPSLPACCCIICVGFSLRALYSSLPKAKGPLTTDSFAI